MQTTDDIIRIDKHVFIDCLKNLKKTDIPDSLYNKKKDLISNLKTYSHEKKLKHKEYISNSFDTSKSITKRMYLISTNFSEENKAKKVFIGILNKLTDKNKFILFPELLKKEFADIIFYDIIWDFIKKNFDKNYITLLNSYDTSFNMNKWTDYIDNKLWIPPQIMIDNDLFNSNEKYYDIYCDFVKWKKEITNIHNTFCIIFDKEYIFIILNNLFNLFENYMLSKIHKHIIDYTLHQILLIMKIYKNNDIIFKLKNIDINTFDSSSKFILLDIIDLK